MNTAENNSATDYQFKVLYAIGMVLVVANHVRRGPVSLFYEFFPAYAFHMGMFVFASGYFYKDSSASAPGNYILKKIRRLIIPLYLYNFVYALVAQLFSLRGFTIGNGATFEQLLIGPITTGHQFMYNLATWFVIPLFMVELFNVFFRRLLLLIKMPAVREGIYAAASAVLGMLCILLACRGYNTGWWLVLTRFLHFVPFYSAGFLYRKIFRKHDTLPNSLYFAVILGLQLLIIIHKGGPLSYEQAWSRFTEFTAWPYIVGFLGIAFWLRISRILEPSIGKSPAVNLIADNTFSIMANQFLGFRLVNAVYAAGYFYTDSLFRGFDWNEYHTNIFYSYLPKGLSQTLLIYVVAGIAVPILIQKCIDRIRDRILLPAGDSRQKKTLILAGIYLCLCIATITPARMIAAHVRNSGGAKIPVDYCYQLGKMLSFDTSHDNVDKYCVTGFSTHEVEHTWTDGKEAVMRFYISDLPADEDRLLEFDCGVYGESQVIGISVNGNEIGMLKAEHDGTYSLPIPAAFLSGSTVEVRFDLPEAASPADNGDSNDTRLLGLSMKHLVLK